MDLIAKIRSLTKEQKLASVLLIISLIPLIGSCVFYGFLLLYVLPFYAFFAILLGITGQIEIGVGLCIVLGSIAILISSIFLLFRHLKKNNFRYIFGFMLWLIYLELWVLGFFIFAYVFAN
jgi:hypothetical protein